MEIISSCPVCASSETKPFISCTDYTVTQKTFQIVECLACAFLFTNPRPQQEGIGEYYQSEDYISHSNSNKGLFNKLYKTVRNVTIARKLRIINKHVSRGTLLDIGCGTGEFLLYCKQQGWKTIGIEPGESARKFAQEYHKLDVRNEESIKDIPASSYDVVTLWHVLEHVHELNERVSELNRVVKDNGIVIIAVPNHTSYDASHYKEFWAAYDLPRHLYHFSPKTITSLFQKHGLKKVETLPMKFDPYYVSMLSEKYKTGKIKYLEAQMTGFKSNQKASTKKDDSYSSQIYIFKKG